MNCFSIYSFIFQDADFYNKEDPLPRIHLSWTKCTNVTEAFANCHLIYKRTEGSATKIGYALGLHGKIFLAAADLSVTVSHQTICAMVIPKEKSVLRKTLLDKFREPLDDCIFDHIYESIVGEYE